MKLAPLKNKQGFTLVEIMISMVIFITSVLAVSSLYIGRKKDEVTLRTYTQVQTITQSVISRYYSKPGDFPVLQSGGGVGGGGNILLYVGCYTGEGRVVSDFIVFSIPTIPIAFIPTTNFPSNFTCENAFQVLLIPGVVSFNVKIFPTSANAVIDQQQLLHNSQFEMPYEQNLSTTFPY